MKRILSLFVLLIVLCGCSEEYELSKLGYTEEDIVLISSLSKEKRELFEKSYDSELLSLIRNEYFVSKNMDRYLKYRNEFDDDTMMMLVNQGLLDDNSLGKLKEILKDPFVIMDRLFDYLRMYDRYENIRSLVEAVNSYSCFEQYYKDYKSDTSKDLLIICNKFHSLPDGFVPENLVDVDLAYTKSKIKLRKECYEAYVKMAEDAKKEGLDLSINSAYRSYDLQVWTYNNFLKSDPQEVVDTYSARPGYSEHQTGLAIDIIAQGYTFGNFHTSKEAAWLKENAWKYGFILRYPEDKTDVTLYKYEAWHYRYVGDEAEKIVNSGLTFDEYYAYYIED